MTIKVNTIRGESWIYADARWEINSTGDLLIFRTSNEKPMMVWACGEWRSANYEIEDGK